MDLLRVNCRGVIFLTFYDCHSYKVTDSFPLLFYLINQPKMKFFDSFFLIIITDSDKEGYKEEFQSLRV